MLEIKLQEEKQKKEQQNLQFALEKKKQERDINKQKVRCLCF